MNFFSKTYSLRKSRQIMKSGYSWYKKRAKDLTSDKLTQLENTLQELDNALLAKERESADKHARALENFSNTHFTKSVFDYLKEIVIALGVALLIAIVVRQMWFEHYQIPSGSMRPTFKEQDQLIVSKTSFGLNIPLKTDHFYFDPNLVQRSSVLIFSADKIELIDSDTSFMWFFPYKKRLIKRLIGKPGDTLYYYGGKVYGIDSNGNDLTELRDSPWMKNLEYVPFLNFEGRETQASGTKEIVFNQTNLPIGRIRVGTLGNLIGEIYNGKEWIEDKVEAAKEPHKQLKTYSDFWGMGNFAMARLLTKQQVLNFTDADPTKIGDGVLYLELRHHPSMSSTSSYGIQRSYNHYDVLLKPLVSIIPLNQSQLDTIMDNMYTARFTVNGGRGIRFNMLEKEHVTQSSPRFPGVPDGTYEFYFGKAAKIGWGGTPSELSADHPLYNKTPNNIQRLYNTGIEMLTQFEPQSKNQVAFPNRYAYFRDGDLYLLGAPVLKKEDPTLIKFVESEKAREQQTSVPYIAFIDKGEPLKDGVIDKEFIKTFGLHIPEKNYLVLGDNHAMSGDSRIFGFLPEANIQGAPTRIIWPFGERWGAPAQKPYPFMTIPRAIVWGIFLTIIGIWYAIHRKNLNKPIFRKR